MFSPIASICFTNYLKRSPHLIQFFKLGHAEVTHMLQPLWGGGIPSLSAESPGPGRARLCLTSGVTRAEVRTLPSSSSAGPGKLMPGWTRSPPSSSAREKQSHSLVRSGVDSR